MRVRDILEKIEDVNLYIELRNLKSDESYGTYKKNELIHYYRFDYNTIKKINVQYIENKRTIVLYV